MSLDQAGYNDGRTHTLGDQLRQLGVALLVTSPLVVRFMLGVASVVWGIQLLLWHGIFDRPNYAVFAWLSSWIGLSMPQGEALLAASLILHGVGVAYCLILDRRASRWVHNAVNVYGFALWALIVVSVHVAVGGPVPLAITETLLTVGAFISIAAVDLRVRPVKMKGEP